jgi:hypothetical protein
MQYKIVSNILLKTDPLLAGIALLTCVFLFFILKSRFLKMASMKSYAFSFYAFVFFIVAAFSFVVMNSVVRFFYLPDHFFGNLLWFFPYIIISGLFGALSGYIIYMAAKKVAPEFVYTLLNISLLIFTPMLMYVLLFQPYLEMVNIALGPEKTINIEKSINQNDFEELNQKPEQIYFPATPAEFHDSLSFHVLGKSLQITSKQNGFSFSQAILNKETLAIYTCDSKNKEYIALLLVYSLLSNQSELLVINKEGLCVFKKTYDKYPNRLSIGEDGKTILLQKEEAENKFVFIEALGLK